MRQEEIDITTHYLYLKVEEPGHQGEVFDCLPKVGEMRMAKVLSVVKLRKSQRRGLLNLAFDLQTTIGKFEAGQKLTGRVIRVSHNPPSVHLQLPNGQQATLCATAIADSYEKIFYLYALRQEQDPQRNYVCTEGRYESYLMQKDCNEYLKGRRLLTERSDVAVGLECDGFLTKHMSNAALIEIGPGIVGRLLKIHQPVISSLALNCVVSVRIDQIDDQGRISLSFIRTVQSRTVSEKRNGINKMESEVLEEDSSASVKKLEKITFADPGFDWSNTGFRPEDLAAVGKIGDDNDVKCSSTNLESSRNTTSVILQHEKGRKRDSNSMSKEEQEIEKERALASRETQLSCDFLPDTQEDFDRLLRKDPSSSEIWIRYISFFLEKNNLGMARATAERALSVINFREEEEIFNIWTAYLNMEVAYGDDNSAREVFQRSCSNADALKMHKQMAAILFDSGKIDEADEVYEAMLKKFRADSDDVWTLYGEHLMKTDRAPKARDLMKRALTSVPKQRHIPIISRFAQMEFRNGDVERGRTLFESLVDAYPKKTDLWLVYVDLSLKHSGIEMARQILEKACALRLSMHKLRPLFHRWMEIEERFGDDSSRKLVKEKAAKALEKTLNDVDNQSSLVGSTSTYDPTLIPSSRRSAVLSSLSRFRSRLGTEMNEIIPNLYLGSLRDAVDEAQLRKNEIQSLSLQYVVSVHDLSTQHPAHEQLKVLRIKLSDCPSVDISAHFAATNQFIHSARLEQAAVLVHCLAGISRSAAVVAAYLITVCDLSFFNALTFISRKRLVINPNFGFRMQLCTFADRVCHFYEYSEFETKKSRCKAN
ncbi:dual specificity phosphatase, catalytic domain protein [Dictyocaulus viviparus]|uniref:Dual specificity phosphatase, catalytic domain protein n=1 Tax=Dictyocaulus viviparus TaxID=29172 RepID=A0A0D8Y8U2_DICVI|nr:dual specificity phosphatase, catalytic domain protein [Dictyocaulus viviparus]